MRGRTEQSTVKTGFAEQVAEPTRVRVSYNHDQHHDNDNDNDNAITNKESDMVRTHIP